MKNIFFFLALAIIPWIALNPEKASADFCSSLEGLSLYSVEDLQYLGSFTSKYDSDSIINKFGTYGSKFNSLSIFNKFGDYGSKFSDTSPWNKFASNPPLIIDNDFNSYGVLSLNRFAGGTVIHPMQALTCFIPLSDGRMEDFLWALDEFDGYEKINSPDTPSFDYSQFDYSQIITCLSNSTLINNSCYCNDGYKLSTDGQNCVIDLQCQANSTLIGSSCYCNDGYVYRNGSCVTHTQDCKLSFGENIGWGVEGDIPGTSNCYCLTSYDWNETKTACVSIDVKIEQPVTPPELLKETDNYFADKQKGKILLQVESLGEAWYVHPDESKRYYMRDGTAAYSMMRSFGLGIKDIDLTQIPAVFDTTAMKSSASICSTNSLADRLKGKILLQVEQNGEAWYVDPTKCHRIYMKDGEAAYEIMKFLGLGITNDDLFKISRGSI